MKYSEPNAEILHESFGTLRVVKKQQPSEEILTVIAVKNIVSVVTILPLPNFNGLWFLAEKPGLNVSQIGGQEEELTEV